MRDINILWCIGSLSISASRERFSPSFLREGRISQIHWIKWLQYQVPQWS